MVLVGLNERLQTLGHKLCLGNDHLMNGSNQEQIEDLQTRIAYQEDTISVLSDQIAKQDAQIQTLAAQLKAVNKKLNELASQGQEGASSEQELPPHY